MSRTFNAGGPTGGGAASTERRGRIFPGKRFKMLQPARGGQGAAAVEMVSSRIVSLGKLALSGSAILMATACIFDSEEIKEGNRIKGRLVALVNKEIKSTKILIREVAGQKCSRVCPRYKYDSVPGLRRPLRESEWALEFQDGGNVPYAVMISEINEIDYSNWSPNMSDCYPCSLAFWIQNRPRAYDKNKRSYDLYVELPDNN